MIAACVDCAKRRKQRTLPQTQYPADLAPSYTEALNDPRDVLNTESLPRAQSVDEKSLEHMKVDRV
jgi:hypothetical protein